MNFKNPELLDTILQNPQKAMRLALILRNRHKPIPDNVLNSVIRDPMMGSNFARTLAQDYIFSDEVVPPQLLQAVSENPKDAYYLAKYYKKHDLRVPEIIFNSVKNSQYFGQFQSSLIGENAETPSSFQSDFLKKILRNEDMTLRFVDALLKKNQPVPEHVENAIESFNDAETARKYIIYLFQYSKPVSEKFYKIVSKDSEQSWLLAKEVLESGSKIVADLGVIHSLAKISEYASAYGVALLSKKIINQKILKILEDAISKIKKEKTKKSSSGISYDYVDPETDEKKKSEYAGQYASVYARILGDLPSETLMKMVKTKYLTYIGVNLLNQGKTIPNEIIKKISNDPPRAFSFMAQYKLARGSKPLPPYLKKIKIAANKYEKDTI